jgi:DNA transformation protein
VTAVDAGHVQDLFASFGPVGVRRMFGGAGVFADGVMFALIKDDVIYLKADDHAVPSFEREGSQPFSYMARKDKRVIMSYWRLPQRLYDDPDEMACWARKALAVAQRSRASHPAKRRSGSRTRSSKL